MPTASSSPLDAAVEQAELQADAQRHDDRRHDQAGHRDVEQRVAARELLAEGQARQHREHARSAPSPRAPSTSERRKRRADVDHAQALGQLAEPVQRHAAHREGQAALRAPGS